jgi:RNA-binding protein 5/10
MNDGERDMASSPPSQFLLFRGLEPTVSEELLAKGALKLTVPSGVMPESSKTGPIGAKETSLKRVLLVRDRKTDESWRYGFVEFATAMEAQAALAAYNKMEKFTITAVSRLRHRIYTREYLCRCIMRRKGRRSLRFCL